MSYRTEVNGLQIFGKNECYPEWIEFIKSQGIAVGEEGQYDGEITDFMGAMDACERIVLGIEERRREHPKKPRSLFDLSEIREHLDDEEGCATLFDELFDIVRYGYLFIPMMLFHACSNCVELDLADERPVRSYKLKPGYVIKVHAG